MKRQKINKGGLIGRLRERYGNDLDAPLKCFKVLKDYTNELLSKHNNGVVLTDDVFNKLDEVYIQITDNMQKLGINCERYLRLHERLINRIDKKRGVKDLRERYYDHKAICCLDVYKDPRGN